MPFDSFLTGVLAHYLSAPQAVCVGAVVIVVVGIGAGLWLRVRCAQIGGAVA